MPGITQLIATSPSAQSSLAFKPDCSSRIIKAQAPVVLPTCTWPIHKSTDDVVTANVTSMDVDPVCISTPALAGNSWEAETGTNLFQILPTAEPELCRCSQATEMEFCRFSRLHFGDRCYDSRDCHSARSAADANGPSVATAANSGADGSVSGETMQLRAHD